LLDGGAELFPCGASDALDLQARLGEQVIVAASNSADAEGYVALGVLNAVGRDDTGSTLARVGDLRLFPEPLMFIEAPPGDESIADLSEQLFSQIIARALGQSEIDDAPVGDDFVVAIYQFTNQLARQQHRRCSFSDVTTNNGVACVIRPLKHGGKLHISNFLYLDPEPGVLFERFAWTVGPRFEIIIDTYATSPNIADTVNHTGLLALHRAVSAWPDREALAWHREQFFARLGAT
jgi:hypothetical protein